MTEKQAIYELSICARVTWQAHSASNAGNNGSNRLMPRHQLLADGHETDACSGNIAKHHHAVLLAEYLEAAGSPLCPACSARDGRRAAALIDQPAYRDLTLERIVRECGVCDAHGFLVTAKNAASDGSAEARQRLSKHSLIEFSFALALPGCHTETAQLFTRSGESKEEGQMLMKMSARSGEYAICVRYKSAGIGLDTERWRAALFDEQERLTRHRAVLAALSDSLLSPQGALTATMLPHLTGLRGAIALRTTVGRAPLYSALQEDFVERLSALADEACTVYPFETIDAFHRHMQALIEKTCPSMPTACRTPLEK
jgi:CRISPR/Cas system-associated protein Cas7 (RAMP superfamily)